MRSIKWWWIRVSAQLPLSQRSGGVRVNRTTARHIRTGNAARDHQDWQSAAVAYRHALAREPHLQHVWVQLGHMEKEAGEIDQATRAYEEAARLRPDDTEPLLRLGHLAKAWRQPIDAAAYFIAALQRDRGNLQALSELVRLFPDRDDVEPDLWSTVLDVLEIEPNDRISDDTGHLPTGAVVLDVTDLLAFFGQRRLPTGIQRVQIEVSLVCLEQMFDPQPVFCVYSSARRGWIRLSREHFDTLCRLAKQSDDVEDPAWTSQLDRMYRKIAVARTLRFSSSTVLVNLGTSWADRNYLLDVRIVRARDGVVYVPLVFDLIPLIGPQWFMQSLVRDYRAWFGSLLHSADGFLAISQATREDLVRVSAEWRAPVPPASVPVVRLDGDFRQAAADGASLHAYGLEPGSYALLVSTLEPRKNHRTAFEAWLALADTLGEARVPRLVCVGGRGWLNEGLHQMLREKPALRRMVLILHGIPDDTLAALYEHCLFALYPSFYEGWGLPVSEALSYGKVPAISRVSSLPEAGGRFAHYFDPSDPADIAATVRALLDAPTRHTAEAVIRQDYVPRTWRGIAQDVVAKARSVSSRVQETLPCLTDAGSWTLALPHQADTFDRPSADAWQGEALRQGRAWQSPGLSGCRVDGNDAALWFHWAGPPGAMLHIHFAPGRAEAMVEVGIGGVERTGRIRPGMPEIVSCPLPNAAETMWITIVPIVGDVIVEKIEIAT
ncbi:glycosyltransferase [Sphingomonas sp. PB2P12]|uniref:glycosyltransferase family 4 protein n=1 Tax=Sphingomonas sandaracina TaxID=3096157 RepID=UPI002FCA3551